MIAIIYIILSCLWLGASIAFMDYHKEDLRYWSDMFAYTWRDETIILVTLGTILPWIAIPIVIFYLLTRSILRIFN